MALQAASDAHPATPIAWRAPIGAWLERTGHTLEDLAELVGVNRDTAARWAAGMGVPRRANARRLALLLLDAGIAPPGSPSPAPTRLHINANGHGNFTLIVRGDTTAAEAHALRSIDHLAQAEGWQIVPR